MDPGRAKFYVGSGTGDNGVKNGILFYGVGVYDFDSVFDFLKAPEEDIYTHADGRPFNDQR